MRKYTLRRLAVGGALAIGLAATLGAGTAHADLRTTYAAGPIVFPGGGPVFPQQVAVNKNIDSPYYGYVYVADYGGGNANQAAIDQKRIHIWKPVRATDGTGAETYVDTGLRIVPSTTGQFDPFGVAVGSDDTVWIGNPTAGTIEAAPPVPAGTDTVVTATPQITGAGFVRGLYVVGDLSDVTIVAAGSGFVEKYTGSAPSITTAGTFTQVYNTAITGLNSGPYGPAMDTAGNVYIVTKTTTAGNAAFIKLDTTGAIVPFPAVIPPNFISTSDLSSAGFVPDATYAGGGYLYSINRTGTTTNGGDTGMRFDLAGNYLDGYGPAVDPAPANYTPLQLPRNNTYGTTDDLGNVIQKVSFEGNGAYQKILKLAPFVTDAAAANSAGAAVKSSPTAVGGVVYFGADDGKLYAYTTETGNPVPGFPVDVAAAVGTAVTIQARPTVYTIDDVTRVYFVTERGDVGRVNADGSGLVITNPPVPGANNVGAPAVTPDGSVYVGLSHPLGSGVVKLNPDMSVGILSSLLGGAGSSISSVAVDGGNVYVGLTGGTSGDIVLLNATDLTPRGSGVAGGEGVTAPPYVNGINAYVGTLAGNFYKVNSVTFAADPTFGVINTPATPGRAAIGEALPTSPFLHEGTFFVGSSAGKLWQVDATTGAFSVAYDTGNTDAAVSGVVVNRDSDTVAFGTTAGVFYQYPVGGTNAQVFRGYGAFHTTPTLDRATGRFLIGSDDQNVYAFSSR